MILEAPVFTIEAALKAASYGVHRLELCSDFGEGGETPSVGALSYLKEKINIPIFVMIRPRGGDFIYTSEELEVMRRDIRILKSFGADGFVFGVLNQDGRVDQKACKLLLDEAEGLPCTFHRAFDICRDKEEAIETLISLGFKRILTSGGENTAALGLSNILQYMIQAAGRIIILPGGGSKVEHIGLLKASGQLKEIHASCKTYRPSTSLYRHPKVSLSNDQATFHQVLTIDEAIVREFLNEMQG
ncbi:copper homeostasis protein CutC [Cecembia calidifontis]|jgi:copper homeostasis protein|uniref:PF03932 family protein CutC n=1 Tax=Cecembia calidifontis TaxID=1187080 RepID=A0A4Q7P833_9BACT|nr:copper homeostasis protein CutC [Cecembia calidifontis]RZS96235.1 copper homeostasis protein [Cecembia calidifontis]